MSLGKRARRDETAGGTGRLGDYDHMEPAWQLSKLFYETESQNGHTLYLEDIYDNVAKEVEYRIYDLEAKAERSPQ